MIFYINEFIDVKKKYIVALLCDCNMQYYYIYFLESKVCIFCISTDSHYFVSKSIRSV